jgi:hypothetical protein
MTLVKIKLDVKDAAYISANPTKVLLLNEPIYRDDGLVAYGDGVTPLSGLVFKPLFNAPVTSVNSQTGSVVLPRVHSLASSTSYTLDLTTYDEADIYALSGDVTINAPSGTPRDGQKIIYRYKDNGTQRNITLNAAFVSLVTVPANTSVGKVGLIGARWSAARSKWEIIAAVTEP